MELIECSETSAYCDFNQTPGKYPKEYIHLDSKHGESLKSRVIWCIGTVQQNILPNCKFSTEQDFKKKLHGFSQEYATKFDSVNVPPVILKYNSSGALISTFVDDLPSYKWGDLIGKKREHV